MTYQVRRFTTGEMLRTARFCCPSHNSRKQKPYHQANG